ncbi:MAG: hypothetical protein EOP09_10965 [Proteobacteria bacterium]|nr:MAG: hypothetical protein EOP09_10965 [Pseudomonadota bacterium]
MKTYPADRCPNGQGSNETFDCCEGGQAKVGQCCEAVGSATITPTSTSTVAPSTAPGNGNGNGNGNGIVSNDFDIEFYLQGPYSFNSR